MVEVFPNHVLNLWEFLDIRSCTTFLHVLNVNKCYKPLGSSKAMMTASSMPMRVSVSGERCCCRCGWGRLSPLRPLPELCSELRLLSLESCGGGRDNQAICTAYDKISESHFDLWDLHLFPCTWNTVGVAYRDKVLTKPDITSTRNTNTRTGQGSGERHNVDIPTLTQYRHHTWEKRGCVHNNNMLTKTDCIEPCYYTRVVQL